MNELTVMGIAKDALWLVALVSAPALGFGLAVGLLVSIFQAVTSIQEMTLAIIPKIVAVFVALLVFGPWCIKLLMSFTYQIIASIPQIVR
jgi:flagellar biosynthetic protein FliQ